MIFRQVVIAGSAFVLSISLFSGSAHSQIDVESELDYEDIQARHLAFARFELITGANQTMPGLTISYATYYKAPTFFGFGATVTQFDGPALIAMFAEMRFLPPARPLAETFAVRLGYWAEVSSAGTTSDEGLMFGFSVGLTGRAFGARDSRMIGEIGYRFIGRPYRDFVVTPPCGIDFPCGPSNFQKRNTHNLVFSLGVLF